MCVCVSGSHWMSSWSFLKFSNVSSCPCPSRKVLDDGQPPKQHHWQNQSVSDWTCQQVGRWLTGLSLEKYIPEFTAKNVDGEQLLQLDSGALKVEPRPPSPTLTPPCALGKWQPVNYCSLGFRFTIICPICHCFKLPTKQGFWNSLICQMRPC